jgi:hypothetical protein
MRLLRYLHEEMIKPASNSETTKEQSTSEISKDQDRAEEKEVRGVDSARTSGR